MVETKILIVDDVNFCTALGAHFERRGYDVLSAYDGATALELVKSAQPDAVVLGSSDGRGMLASLRRESGVPVVMLTEGADVSARVALFEAGADDVLAKPADPRELAARVGAILRRTNSTNVQRAGGRGDVIRFDNFEISRDRFELKLRGEKVEIPPKELQLLYCLASNPNRVFSREHLLEHVWDFAFLGNSRTVDVHIKRLREKLAGVSDKWALKTVWGVGYKFELIN